jgi:hypothetical protein
MVVVGGRYRYVRTGSEIDRAPKDGTVVQVTALGRPIRSIPRLYCCVSDIETGRMVGIVPVESLRQVSTFTRVEKERRDEQDKKRTRTRPPNRRTG